MEKTENERNSFGLIGRDISYSFSKAYFSKKFADLKLNHSYENFDLKQIEDFEELIKARPDVRGYNVTIPYKESVIAYLDVLDTTAEKIGAVNTIKIFNKGLKGYNTDAFGFQKALIPLLQPHHKKAMILGTGGASRAIAFVLHKMGIPFIFVSRNPGKDQLGYSQLDCHIFEEFTILINCTPLGTFPDVSEKPDIPYECITSKHLLFDLIYNPDRTVFLTEGFRRGAAFSNGLKMLEFQAEKAWEIWTQD
jgi:shikimate dehydrogenase